MATGAIVGSAQAQSSVAVFLTESDLLTMASTNTASSSPSTVWNLSSSTTTTFDQYGDDETAAGEYAFERWDVRATFLIVYSTVFFSCFFGNLMVILTVTLHWRMRNITSFCLANLAFADLCVALFCVYQNLYMYIMKSWVFGAFLCKMYFFITELSHTASILILVVICIERYLAIIHPMRCKEWLTLSRLRMTIVGVWSLSAIYSSPKLIFSDIISHTFDGIEEIICIPLRSTYDSKLYDLVNFGLLFALPLTIITVLYSKIGIVLWKSSHGMAATNTTPSNSGAGPEVRNGGPGGGGEDRERDVGADPSSSSSSNGSPDGAGRGPRRTRKQQVSCGEVLCCGSCKSLAKSSSKCCMSCAQIFGSTKSLPCHGTGGGAAGQKMKMATYSAQVDEKQVNYYFPSLTNVENNSANGGRPSNGILKIHANTNANTRPLSGSVSSSGSSSTTQSEKRGISSTEPIVVVKFDSPTDGHGKSGKRNGHHSNGHGGHGHHGKSSRAHCTILMKTSESDNQIEDAAENEGEGRDHDQRCETESPMGSQRHTNTNSVVWSDKLIEQTESNGIVSTPRTTGSVRRSNQLANGTTTNTTTTAAGRVRRLRVIRSCTYGTRALKSRRRVIRMLVVIVFVFALCNLPFHARKMWQYWGSSYSGGSHFSNLFTPITFLIMYLNSAINPILYAFLSKKCRASIWDLLTCRINRSLKMARNASVRSTHVVHMSTAGT